MTQIDQNGWLNLTDSACNQLEGYTSSPRRFFPYGGDCITGASTIIAPSHGRMARLSWHLAPVTGYTQRGGFCPMAVANPNSDRDQRVTAIPQTSIAVRECRISCRTSNMQAKCATTGPHYRKGLTKISDF